MVFGEGTLYAGAKSAPRWHGMLSRNTFGIAEYFIPIRTMS